MPPSPSRPRDSASLVLIRGAGHGREVLLGRRPASARFMPGRYVFPGGVLEPEDGLASGFAEALAAPPPGADGATRRRLASFARAALRETFEETGLLLGTPAARPCSARRGVWRAFAEQGLTPAFGALSLLATAITPSSYPLRFHARFFLADGRLAEGLPRGQDELEAVAWMPIRGLDALPMPSVTRRVLRKALSRRCIAPAPRSRGGRLRAWRFG